MVIQRIQTLFLLLAVLFLGICCFATLNTIDPDTLVKVYQNNIYLIPTIIALVINLYAIFIFKKSNLQKSMTVVAGIISFILLLLVVFGQFTSSENVNWLPALYYFLAMAFDWLALRGIIKDARLLADSNRLR